MSGTQPDDYIQDAEEKAQALYDIAREQIGRHWWDQAREIRAQTPGEDGTMDAVNYMMDRMGELFDDMVDYGHMDEDDMNQEAWDMLWSIIDAGLD